MRSSTTVPPSGAIGLSPRKIAATRVSTCGMCWRKYWIAWPTSGPPWNARTATSCATRLRASAALTSYPRRRARIDSRIATARSRGSSAADGPSTAKATRGALNQTHGIAMAAHVMKEAVARAKIDAGEGPPGALTTAERQELAQLRRENHQLRMEREILKKATAFFAKESS